MLDASSETPEAADRPLPARPSERALIDYVCATSHAGGNLDDASVVFCTSAGRGQLADVLATKYPQAKIVCNFLDLHAARLAAESLANRSHVTVACETDAPLADGSCGLIALPLTANGDAEWTQELLDAAHRLLEPDGILIASTDNPDDRWLREQLQRRLGRVSAVHTADAIVYRAVCREPPGKAKNHVCWFAFRDGTRILRVVSRPGVFSHRRLDTGARALMEAMRIGAGNRVIEIGCGSGAVSIAAAARAEHVQALAIDSNPRAVQCTRWGAEVNGLAEQSLGAPSELAAILAKSVPVETAPRTSSHVQAVLDADARCDHPGSYDVALANPPYYSKHRITQLFAAGAARALRPDGMAYFVTKDATWYVEHLPTWFDDLEVRAIRGYLVVSGRRMSD